MDNEADDIRGNPSPDTSTNSEPELSPEPPAPEVPKPRPQLTLIGTGHVFQIEQTIRDAIKAIEPNIVFVELDQGRFNALMYRRKHGKMPPSGGGFVQKRLAAFQESVAGSYGAEVGGEMVAAVEGARDIRARVGLIDMPAQITVKRALKQLTWKEKRRAVGQLIQGAWYKLWRRGGQSVESEIQKYQDDSAAALEELRRQYPTVYRVVIDDRDEFMASRIQQALAGGGIGVAVVGDGHVNGMLKRLSQLDDWDITTYRLEQVRNGLLPKPEVLEAQGDSTGVSYGFNVDL